MITDKKITHIANFYTYKIKNGKFVSSEVKRELVRIITQKNNP